MVGGWNFNRSKFNRAVQAYRQLGSTFKPIVYTTAIDRGFTPTSTIIDTPVSYETGSNEPYTPQNYDHKFEGPITLRQWLSPMRAMPHEGQYSMSPSNPAHSFFPPRVRLVYPVLNVAFAPG